MPGELLCSVFACMAPFPSYRTEHQHFFPSLIWGRRGILGSQGVDIKEYISERGRKKENLALILIFLVFPFFKPRWCFMFLFLSSDKLFCQDMLWTWSIISSALKRVRNLAASGTVELHHQGGLQLSDVSILVHLEMWLCSLHVAFFNSLVSWAQRKKLICHVLSHTEKLRNALSTLARCHTWS